MFKFFSKNKEVNTTELTSILAEERKKQNEIMTQTIEKLNVSFQETLQRQQEEFIQKSSTFWNGYEQANANSLIQLEEYRKQEFLKQEEIKKESIKAQEFKAAYALNMCMVSLSQIVDYHDIHILHQEYDAILNNLNLENMIKDESLLDALKKILDTCHFYILHEKDKELLKKKQADRLKGALGKALGGKSIIAVFGNPNPWAMVAGAAVLIGSAAVSYKSEKNKAQMENESEKWELEKTALEQLHNLRKMLFETAWRLAEKYNFKDEYRLTEKQIKIYNDAVADPDPLNRCERLDLLKDQFVGYPLFWYYLGRAALEAADLYRPSKHDGSDFHLDYRKEDAKIYNEYRKKAKEALDYFVEKHSQNQLLREDVVAASAYLDASDFYWDNPMKMKECIDNARKIAGMDLEILQTCAFRYGQLAQIFCNDESNIAGKKNLSDECRAKSIYCLRLLLSEWYNPDLNGQALSQLYLDGCKKNEQEYRGKYLVLKECLSQKVPFVYSYIKPFDDQSCKDDLKKLLSPGSGSLLNIIGQYIEARVRYMYRNFYKAVYETDMPGMELENFSKVQKKWIKDKSVDGCSENLSGPDKFLSALFPDFQDKEKKNIGEYLFPILSDGDKENLVAYKEAIIERIDGAKNADDKLEKSLKHFVEDIASVLCNKLRAYADKIRENESDVPNQTSEEFWVSMVSSTISSTEEIRQKLQSYTKGKIEFNEYKK